MNYIDEAEHGGRAIRLYHRRKIKPKQVAVKAADAETLYSKRARSRPTNL